LRAYRIVLYKKAPVFAGAFLLMQQKSCAIDQVGRCFCWIVLGITDYLKKNKTPRYVQGV